MAFFQVSSRELRNSANNLEELLQRFKTQKEELSTNATALKSMWEGEANDAFFQAFLKDMGQVEAFVQLIDNYIRVIEMIADRYDAAEAKNLGIATNRSY